MRILISNIKKIVYLVLLSVNLTNYVIIFLVYYIARWWVVFQLAGFLEPSALISWLQE